jgi:hypothetical protein
MPAKPLLKSIPSDLELLKTAHLNDVARIASTSSREDLIAAIRWCDGNREGNQTRRKTIAEALRKQGDAK